MAEDIFREGGQLKIGNTVISVFTIDVVDYFRLGQFSTQMLFHKLPVFQYSLCPGNPQADVTSLGKFPAALPVGAILALRLFGGLVISVPWLFSNP